MLTQERILEVLTYDACTGNFFWKKNMRGQVKSGDMAGFSRGDGYVSIKIDGEKEYAHRLAWLYVFGFIPDSEIDHIDHNPSNNAISNLRVVSSQGNSMNSSIGTRNKSGIIGVHWSKHANKWVAQIRLNGVTRHIGYFNSIEDAATARKSAELSLGFHKNHGGLKWKE